MDNNHSNIKSFVEKLGEYLETKIILLKLKGIEKSASIFFGVVLAFILFSIFFIFIIIFNVGLALWVGELTGKPYYGFFIVAVFYILLGALIYYFRCKWIKTPISNMFIKKVLKQ